MRRLIRIVVGLCLILLLVLGGFRMAAHLREGETLAEAMPADGRLIETAQGKIFVLEYGPETGQPLLFAHGTAAWSGLWQPVLEAMGEAGYRGIGYDLPPFGYSERYAVWDYGRVAQGERVNALVEAMDIKPIVVAHSFGAGPAMEAVMRAPERYAGIVVVDGALGLGSHDEQKALPFVLRPLWAREVGVAVSGTNPLATRTLLKGLIHRKDAATDAVIATLQRPQTRMGTTESFAAWLPSLMVPPQDALSIRTEAYAALGVPVAYIWGDQDTVTPPDQAEALVALTPGATLHMLTDVGHIPQIEDEAAFLGVLRPVIRDIENLATPQ